MLKATLFAIAFVVAMALTPIGVQASDHDDGEIDAKGRALNLTDLYVFKEGDQTGVAADNKNLIFIMNVNPRSLAGQQYYWSTQARYDFHITRVADSAKDTAPKGTDDVILRFTFGARNATTNVQQITATMIQGTSAASVSKTTTGNPIVTTPLSGAASPVSNSVTLNGKTVTIFAGLREDPFFFDVEQFFRVRSYLAGATTGIPNAQTLPGHPFRAVANAVDFTKGYNVNSLVVRVPIALLQSAAAETSFDTWATISIPK